MGMLQGDRAPVEHMYNLNCKWQLVGMNNMHLSNRILHKQHAQHELSICSVGHAFPYTATHVPSEQSCCVKGMHVLHKMQHTVTGMHLLLNMPSFLHSKTLC